MVFLVYNPYTIPLLPESCPHDPMGSRATINRHRLADKIDRCGSPAMVSCSYCQRRRLPCRMLSLSKRCGACNRAGNKDCSPGDLPLVDFSKTEKELARLRAQIREAKQDESLALERLQTARARLLRLKTQKRAVESKEREIFDKGLQSVEELEQLEAIEELGTDFRVQGTSDVPAPDALNWLLDSSTEPPFDPFSSRTPGQAIENLVNNSGGASS